MYDYYTSSTSPATTVGEVTWQAWANALRREEWRLVIDEPRFIFAVATSKRRTYGPLWVLLTQEPQKED